MTIDYQAICALSPNPYLVLDRALTIAWVNEAYLRVTMRRREEITGQPLFTAFPSAPGSESRELLQSSLERVIETGAPDEIALIRYDIVTPEGRMEQRYWSATHTPLSDAEGEVAFILQHTVDVTELESLRRLRDESGVVQRASAVQARNSDLMAESQRLHALLEQAPGFMAVLSGSEYRFEITNAAYRRLTDDRAQIGTAMAEALPEVIGQGFIESLDGVRRSGEPYFGRGEQIMLAEDGGQTLGTRYLDFIYQPIFGAEGEVTGIFVQGHDITEEFALVRRQELLINELNHRVKNSLAIVQGLAAQSFRSVDPTGVARMTFDNRLKALAAAHDLLTERKWEPTLLGDTIRTAIEAAAGDAADRVGIVGPRVLLAPQHAVALAMAVHELTTNAIKYGALSEASGHIAIEWYCLTDGHDLDLLTIEWAEHGGPPVTPPRRQGFGTRLIERGLSAEVEGSAKIDFQPDGVRCRIALRLPNLDGVP